MTEYELMLADRIGVIKDVISKYGEGRFYISFSGGKDSCVLSALVDEAVPGNRIPRVFINTGIEYNEIVRFVRERERERGRPLRRDSALQAHQKDPGGERIPIQIQGAFQEGRPMAEGQQIPEYREIREGRGIRMPQVPDVPNGRLEGAEDKRRMLP